MTEEQEPPEFEIEIEAVSAPRRSRQSGLNLPGWIRWAVKPRIWTWGLAALVIIVLAFGTPYMLVTYTCTDRNCSYYSKCDYYGVQGWRTEFPPDSQCQFVKIIPLKW